MNATLTQSQVEAMMAAQDAAAAKFWAYPGQAWQTAFQANWLDDHGLPPFAVGPDGLAYGKMTARESAALLRALERVAAGEPKSVAARASGHRGRREK